MALKAVHVSDVPNLDQVPDLYTSRLSSPGFAFATGTSISDRKFLVIGHRGNGMNMLQSSDSRMNAVKENTILSFNTASQFPLDFIEFDVQVTTDGCPIIFHDNFIYTCEKGTISEKRVTELSLAEFLSYGPQREDGREEKALLRKMKDGKIVNWAVESDDSACTLQETFQKVDPALGFNIELKFDDHLVYTQEHLTRVLEAVVQVVSDHAKDRPIIFSSFQPDAALLMRNLQGSHPVFFLTNGGNEIYHDVRRNSLDEAMKVCLEGSLQGIVSEVRAVLRNPGAVNKIKESKLSLLTYGKLNNVAEAVYMQHLMGIEGVIVDLVGEITEAVSKLGLSSEDQVQVEVEVEGKPQFSQRELSFLLKLIPELLQQQ